MPYYCETALNAIGSFPAEPVNTITSLVPALIGALALWQICRQGRPGLAAAGPVAALLALLTLLTGLGSTAWHALRTPLTLTLDAAPGVIYFLVIVLTWPWLLRRAWLGPAILIGLAVIAMAMPRDDRLLSVAVAVLAIVAAAALLLGLTWRDARPALRPALAMVGCAALALAFRSLDRSACATIPVGSHFLWHIFLGFAAYAGVRMNARLWQARRAARSG